MCILRHCSCCGLSVCPSVHWYISSVWRQSQYTQRHSQDASSPDRACFSPHLHDEFFSYFPSKKRGIVSLERMDFFDDQRRRNPWLTAPDRSWRVLEFHHFEAVEITKLGKLRNRISKKSLVEPSIHWWANYRSYHLRQKKRSSYRNSINFGIMLLLNRLVPF